MPERAWTVGQRAAYEKAVRISGNGKAPSGAAFRTRDEAIAYIESGTRDLAPYEMELPKPYKECVTRDIRAAFMAYHIFHQIEQEMTKVDHCPICAAHALPVSDFATDMLLVPTRFINPDTGEVV